MYRMPQV